MLGLESQLDDLKAENKALREVVFTRLPHLAETVIGPLNVKSEGSCASTNSSSLTWDARTAGGGSGLSESDSDSHPKPVGETGRAFSSSGSLTSLAAESDLNSALSKLTTHGDDGGTATIERDTARNLDHTSARSLGDASEQNITEDTVGGDREQVLHLARMLISAQKGGDVSGMSAICESKSLLQLSEQSFASSVPPKDSLSSAENAGGTADTEGAASLQVNAEDFAAGVGGFVGNSSAASGVSLNVALIRTFRLELGRVPLATTANDKVLSEDFRLDV